MADETRKPDDNGTSDAAGDGLPAAVSAAELEQLRAKAAERDQLHEQSLRTSADLQNLRRRMERDVDDRVRRATETLLLAVLRGIDELDHAIERAEAAHKPIAEGIKLTRETLLGAAQREGVQEIASVGASFDPKLHEAVQSAPAGDKAPGTVVAEQRKGYLWKDRVLRPAQVVVAAGGTGPDPRRSASAESNPT